MIEITDINDSKIELYKSLRYTPKSHTYANVFVAESEKVVLKMLESTIEPVSVFAVPEFYKEYSDLIKSKFIAEENLFTASRELMNQIVGFRIHSGVMSIGKIPADTSLTDLDPRIIILNGIIDAENVGAIVRNCAAFGFNSIIADEKSGSPYLRRAVRVSMGNIFEMKLYHCINIISTINELRENGYQLIAAEICDGSIDLEKAMFNEKFCLIFGSEGNGIDPHVLDLCHDIVYIPISEKVPSINVAASSAVFLHHLRNQINS